MPFGQKNEKAFRWVALPTAPTAAAGQCAGSANRGS